MVKITTEKNSLIIKAPYAYLSRIKGLPSRRWNPTRRAWITPATPNLAKAIVDEFADEVDGDAGFCALLEQADAQAAAQRLKKDDALDQPPIRKTSAWNHQLQAYHFAMNMPAVLLDMGMGTGKTKVCVDLINNRKHKRILVGCPKRVLTGNVWGREIAKHSPVPIRVFSAGKGSCAKRAKDIEKFLLDCLKLGEPAVVVINHEAVWRDGMADTLLNASFDLVIVDESHRIKSPSGKISRFYARLGERVPYRVCLTGTPTPHSPLDVYGQYRFLDKGIFGTSFLRFRARYAVMGGFNGKQVMGYQNGAELKNKVDMIAYHVGRDVLDLPEAVHIYRNVTLDKHTRRIYEQMEKEMVADIEAGVVVASNALSRLMRLQQIASGYLPYDDYDDTGRVKQRTERVGSEKRDELADVLEDLAPREPVVVFARFTHDLNEIRDAVEKSGRVYVELSGRRDDYNAWRNGDGDVLGVQIKAGGEGIDFTRAHYCVYYSLGFSLGDYEQSLARVHRPGQKEDVVYIHIVAEKTVDQKIYDALTKRRKVLDEIFGDYAK